MLLFIVVVFLHFRLTEELQEATRDANGKCLGAKLITATLSGIGYGLTNNGTHFSFSPFFFFVCF